MFTGDLKPCPEKWKGKLRYRQGDLNLMTSAELESFEPEFFIHLAATFERSTESYEFWYENFWHNVRLSNYLMSLAKDLKSIKKVVFASSYLIYDPALYSFTEPRETAVSLKESDPVYPRNLTGMAKLSHEIELRFLEKFRSEQYQIVLTRIFRGFGLGSRDVISRWVRSLLNGEEITVFKKEGMFDFIYSKDTAEGLLRLANSVVSTGIVNLGTGRSRRVSEVVDTLRKHFPDMKVKEEQSEILFEASQSDIKLLKEITGWQPEYDIERAIPEIIEFERERNSDSKSVKWGKILVSSASQKVSLVRSLKDAAAKISTDINVVAGDINPQVLSSFVADEFWVMPQTKEENIGNIISWCSENNIQFVVPSRDGELIFWAKNKALLAEHGINVMISSASSINRCLDKLEFSEFCVAENIPSIPSFENLDDCTSPLYVVKERFGAGSLSIGIALTKAESVEHAQGLINPIFQPFISGTELSADAYINNIGEVHGIILRTRDKVVNGESQITTTLHNLEIEEIVEDALTKLDVRGHVILQLIVDDNNQPHIIECNSRFGGASTLAIKAGLDSFYWFLLESIGEDLSSYPFRFKEEKIRQVRIPQDIYIYGSNI